MYVHNAVSNNTPFDDLLMNLLLPVLVVRFLANVGFHIRQGDSGNVHSGPNRHWKYKMLVSEWSIESNEMKLTARVTMLPDNPSVAGRWGNVELLGEKEAESVMDIYYKYRN